MHRIVFLLLGAVLLASASTLSQSLAFYYSSAMAVGIILVVLLVLFQVTSFCLSCWPVEESVLTLWFRLCYVMCSGNEASTYWTEFVCIVHILNPGDCWIIRLFSCSPVFSDLLVLSTTHKIISFFPAWFGWFSSSLLTRIVWNSANRDGNRRRNVHTCM